MVAYTEHPLAHAAELDAVPPGLPGKMRTLFSDHADVLTAAPRRCLTHGDFGLWIMLVQPIFTFASQLGSVPSWPITSLLEVERSKAGSPAFDFAPMFYDPGEPIDDLRFIEG
jgi:hypothetical protein